MNSIFKEVWFSSIHPPILGKDTDPGPGPIFGKKQFKVVRNVILPLSIPPGKEIEIHL